MVYLGLDFKNGEVIRLFGFILLVHLVQSIELFLELIACIRWFLFSFSGLGLIFAFFRFFGCFGDWFVIRKLRRLSVVDVRVTVPVILPRFPFRILPALSLVLFVALQSLLLLALSCLSHLCSSLGLSEFLRLSY